MVRVIILLILTLTVLTSWSKEFSSCIGSLQKGEREIGHRNVFKIGKKTDWLWKVDYYEFSKRKETSLDFLDAHWSDSDDLILTFGDNGHTTLFFRGYRIDSSGIIGMQVTSGLHKHSHFFNGKVVFVIKDLSIEAVEKLEELLENFRQIRDVTCIHLTCRYLKSIDSERFNEITYLPSHLLENLVQMKKQNPEGIEIFVREDVESISHLHFDWEIAKSGQVFFFSLLSSTLSAASFAGGFYLGGLLGF